MKIVIHPPLTGDELARLTAVAGHAQLANARDPDAARAAITDADGLIMDKRRWF